MNWRKSAYLVVTVLFIAGTLFQLQVARGNWEQRGIEVVQDSPAAGTPMEEEHEEDHKDQQSEKEQPPVPGTSEEQVTPPSLPTSPSLPKRIVLGYYSSTGFKPSSNEFLVKYGNLTDVAFQWYGVNAQGDITTEQSDGGFAAAKSKGVRTQVSVASTDREMLHQLLSSESARSNFVNNAVNLVQRNGCQVFNLDFESLRPEDKDNYNALLSGLSTALKQKGAAFFVAVPAIEKPVSWRAAFSLADIGRYADRVVLMTYDYHYRTGPPGPIAPYDWVVRVVSHTKKYIPANKLILGLGVYGRDWPQGENGKALTFDDAEQLAASLGITPNYGAPYYVPNFKYTDQSGVIHQVWYENRESLKKKIDLARSQGLGGVAIWRMGYGFPGFWEDIGVYK